MPLRVSPPGLHFCTTPDKTMGMMINTMNDARRIVVLSSGPGWSGLVLVFSSSGLFGSGSVLVGSGSVWFGLVQSGSVLVLSGSS